MTQSKSKQRKASQPSRSASSTYFSSRFRQLTKPVQQSSATAQCNSPAHHTLLPFPKPPPLYLPSVLFAHSLPNLPPSLFCNIILRSTPRHPFTLPQKKAAHHLPHPLTRSLAKSHHSQLTHSFTHFQKRKKPAHITNPTQNRAYYATPPPPPSLSPTFHTDQTTPLCSAAAETEERQTPPPPHPLPTHPGYSIEREQKKRFTTMHNRSYASYLL